MNEKTHKVCVYYFFNTVICFWQVLLHVICFFRSIFFVSFTVWDFVFYRNELPERKMISNQREKMIKYVSFWEVESSWEGALTGLKLFFVKSLTRFMKICVTLLPLCWQPDTIPEERKKLTHFLISANLNLVYFHYSELK